MTPTMLILAAVCTAAAPDQTTLEFVPSGVVNSLSGARKIAADFQTEKPEQINRVPEGLENPHYAVIKLHSGSRGVIVDKPEEGEWKVYVDTNGDGDLTNDDAVEVTARDYRGLTTRRASAMIDLDSGDGHRGQIGIMLHDPADTNPANDPAKFYYYPDYGYQGTADIGGKAYKVLLGDYTVSGDYSGKTEGSDVKILIDVNGNGDFDRRGEIYDITKPFNIGGTTYELTDISPTGGTFQVGISDQEVAEIAPPPNLNAGQLAPTFTATTIDGDEITFPDSYKGKIVMIDFWATWCGPCIGEMPHVTSAYEKFKDSGFEVLSISLDRDDKEDVLRSKNEELNMPWPQIYEGGYWGTRLAQHYGISSIPRAILVDGDTGRIIASDHSLRGQRLAETIQSALDTKSGT